MTSSFTTSSFINHLLIGDRARLTVWVNCVGAAGWRGPGAIPKSSRASAASATSAAALRAKVDGHWSHSAASRTRNGCSLPKILGSSVKSRLLRGTSPAFLAMHLPAPTEVEMEASHLQDTPSWGRGSHAGQGKARQVGFRLLPSEECPSLWRREAHGISCVIMCLYVIHSAIIHINWMNNFHFLNDLVITKYIYFTWQHNYRYVYSLNRFSQNVNLTSCTLFKILFYLK